MPQKIDVDKYFPTYTTSFCNLLIVNEFLKLLMQIKINS
ncbi:hypothetical protein Cpin_7178 [Chitinophaga pinensis DSM 2588]|uniref:Uncharacterized protein n=1 Tax=Chitinophaga pinensis (strain ATCC 43595 / DSM 2588 / LMG 13176 / NBRC 15968 / NCIMB 11800 / UQM 2034) TaxID=485918 RepID=A0A979GXE1_CHIPD|nr:hypothetical protein Cpin_7178 [Chitinophaga pinensis DSM 2588]